MTSRQILLVYAALALLTAFYPALFGELPVPAGNALLLLPDGGAPANRNDELTDVPTQFLPWSKAVADAWRTGRLPLRFDANGCGTPLWANPQAQAVTPTTLLALLLPVAWASAGAAAAKLFLAAAGAFFFIRSRVVASAAAFWGGLAYGFSLHMTSWMHFPDTWPMALLPWSFLALERLARGLPGGFAATLAVVLLLLLGGYPESEFYVAVAGAIFFLITLSRERGAAAVRLSRLGRAAAASLLALGLTGVYTLPASIALARSERSVRVARALRTTHPTLAAKDALRPPIHWDVMRFWFVPEAQGNPRDEDKFGPYSFAGRANGYSGVLIAAFALATFFWRRAPRSVVWARRGLVVLALYILYDPPLVYVLQATPGLREVAARLTPNRASSIAILLLALLAALELNRIRCGGGIRATRCGAGIALAATVLVLVEYARTSAHPPLTVWRAASFALPILLLIAVLGILLRPGAARQRALAALLLVGTAVDLLRIGARFNPGTRPADYFPVTPKVREVQQASHGGRLASSEIILAGMAYMYGLEDVRVHGVVAPADYEDVLIATVGYTGPVEYPARVTRLEAPFLDFLNVRARLGPGGALVSRATPLAIFPERLIGFRGEADLLTRLSGETDFRRNAYAIGGNEAFSGSGEVLSYEKPRPEELRLRVRAESPRVLVVPETTDGGWTAEGNGVRLQTFTANGAFLAILVPAGETAIVCRYVPPGFRTGLAITAASAAILLLIVARLPSR